MFTFENYLLVISVVACCIAVPVTTAKHLKVRRLEAEYDREMRLAVELILGISDDAVTMSEVNTSLRRQLEAERIGHQRTRANFNDAMARANRHERTLHNVDLYVKQLIDSLDATAEDEAIANAKRVLGAAVIENGDR